MDRRTFLKAAGTGIFLAGSNLAFAQTAFRPLPLLPLMDLVDGIDGRIPLTLRVGTHNFGNGAASTTFGISNSYLGPLLRVKQGQVLPFDVTNEISETSTLHWHGLHIPGDVDGGPHQEIKPGNTWSPDVPIKQHASMNWFHSHMHGKTAEQTYRGLAGVMLIEDDASLSADLPKTYSIDDFTLVLQDKMFDAAGKMSYSVTGEVFEEGFKGDTLIVNGTIAPVAQSVPTGLTRLRILNACNSMLLTLSMKTGPVTVIASDGGFLGSPVQSDSIRMSPGERYEILVDMTAVESNSLIVRFEANEEGILGFLGGLFGASGPEMTALNLIRNEKKGLNGSMPNKLATITPPNPGAAKVTRSFQLNMGDGEQLAALAAAWGNICGTGGMGINGQPMKMDRIDEKVRKGDTELWRISVDDQLHPFHIHGCSFRILKQNGGTPPAYAQGWKDMVHVEEGWSEVLIKFDYEATEKTPYMYHCHILEHEDCGMMGQFTVT